MNYERAKGNCHGRRIWKEFADVDFDLDHFPAIGQDCEQQGGVKIGQIGAAESRLISQRTAVDFAQDWLVKFREPS